MKSVKQEIIEVKDLLLDPDNPRLPRSIKREQEDMLDYIASNTGIDELISAIAHNDFFQGEALIGIPSKKEAGKYIIVEGNRRLTALKILADSSLTEGRPKLRQLVESAKHRPSEVPVILYNDHKDILNYLGNRHIAGVKPWSALSKARYVKTLYDLTDNKLGYIDRCREVAQTIGSRRDYISKSLQALSALELFESHGFFDFEDFGVDEVKFSLLTTALGYEKIKAFFELGDDIEIYDEKNVNINHLRELFSYLFVIRKGDDHPPLGESRNLKLLAEVLYTPNALESFRSGATLEQAYIETSGVKEDFKTLCYEIQNGLRQANSIAADVDFDKTLGELVGSIFRQAKSLRNISES